MKIFTGANISYQSDIAYECNINFPRRKQSRLCQLSSNQSPKAMSLRFLLNIYFGFFMYIINWARYISPCIQVFFKGFIKIKYLSLHVPFPVFNSAVSQPVSAVLLSPQKIDIFSRYTFEGSKFKNKKIN